ncbi:nitrate reductase molybdenum cofactor assembly chaperone [Pseudomarimonas arenosa]|uniref:Nitrate reductase molybdenum cofactor assembly chaperone n=1 Tax=Pseudomarimonas arenosa TaxID=2774145 RepID=A0AAW3ZM83_9GAMM|nr:nitrate reductase molybdenum cofactor assembly chaperone [Pseudomarimonas arenosa]MBD8526284.1 nitrate reductase molybdenum cofactor assembly chaperone [Pseudomarimonas arenosa]
MNAGLHIQNSVGSDCCGQCTCGEAAAPNPARQLKLISLLLDYPQDELFTLGKELRAAVYELGFDNEARQALHGFIDRLLAVDPMQAQATWSETFDRGRAMSLLMFEHIHGESRDRGQAMVDLMDTYRRNGFEIDSRELPDYLPLLLEYLSQRSEAEGREWLGHLNQILSLLAARAEERESPYAQLFELLIKHSGLQPDLATFRRRAANEERDDTPEAMDKVWEEEAVKFGPQAPATDACAPNRFVERSAGA